MSDKETKGTKGEVWQTVLYRPIKGTEPWKLSISFLEKLREAFGRLSLNRTSVVLKGRYLASLLERRTIQLRLDSFLGAREV